jgi:hypothetical protein
MKRWHAGLAAATIATIASTAGAQGSKQTPSYDDGESDVVVYAPEDSGDVGGGGDGVVGAELSIDTKAEGWLVEMNAVHRDAVAFFFLGLPNPTQELFRVDLGFFGHVDLDIAYPSAPVLLGLPDVNGHAEMLIARPTPLPPEIVGYVLALQGVEAFFVTYVGDAQGNLWTTASYRPTASAELVIQ